jgi:hypothetical protein
MMLGCGRYHERGAGGTTVARLRLLAITVLLVSTGLQPGPAAAQSFNIQHSIAELERRMQDEPFRIIDWRGSRAEGDRTQRVTMSFVDDFLIVVKWANAPPNGEAFNNQPRYEVAAYELQKLFLDEPEYVVPPTLLRSFPIAFARSQIPDAKPTFREAPASVLVALQYWLLAVTADNFWQPARARADTVYARYVGNFNILTHLIRHNDGNIGNFLISTAPDEPRIFSVDNGVAFASPVSDRGFEWRDLQVRRLPRHTVERLRQITPADLEDKLAILAEYEIRDGELVAVERGPNLAPGRGVRRTADRVQLGLTSREIGAVHNRLSQLLRDIDRGRIQVF